jgi:uncharacterized protein YjbI with pentapeptide repeats
VNELVARWMQNPKLSKAVLHALQLGKDPSAFVDTVNGRADLRGFVFPGATALEGESGALGTGRSAPKMRFRSQVWESIDFTGCTLSALMFFNFEFKDVLLHDVDFKGSGFWDCVIRDSELVKSDLRSFCLSAEAKPTRWENSVIRRCDLRGSSMSGGSFHNMEFSSLKANRLSIERCSFNDVRFVGGLDEVQFDDRQLATSTPPRQLERVDLSGARLNDVDFRGWRFDSVTLPDGIGWYPHQLRVSRRVLELVESSAPDLAPMIAAGVRNLVRGVDDDEVDGYFNPAEWQRIGQDSAVAFAYWAALVEALEEMGLSINWGQSGEPGGLR